MDVQQSFLFSSDLSPGGALARSGANLGHILLDLTESQRMNLIGQFMVNVYQKMQEKDQEIMDLRGRVQTVEKENTVLKKCCYEMQKKEIAREAAEKIQALQSQLTRLNLKSYGLDAIKFSVLIPTFGLGTWILDSLFPHDEIWVPEKIKIMMDMYVLENFPEVLKNKELKQEIDEHITKLINQVNSGFELRRQARNSMEKAYNSHDYLDAPTKEEALIDRQRADWAIEKSHELLKDFESKHAYFKAKASVETIYREC